MRSWIVVVVLLLVPSLAHAGYTHYWTWHRAPDPAALQQAVADMQRVVAARASLVVVRSSATGIEIDERADQPMERFSFPGERGFNFCKTGGEPYDEVVTAELLVARAHFSPAVLEIASDGGYDDWTAGRELYTEVFGRQPPLPFASAPRAGAYSAPWWIWYRPALSLLVIGALVYLGLGSRGAGWGSYYLAWLIIPMILAAVTTVPWLLALVVVGFVARRWLPDPWLAAKYAGKVRSLDAQIRANPTNSKARHDLALILLTKRRPGRALVHVEAARQREPDDIELRFLEGNCRLAMREYAVASTILLEVARRDPKFRYGDALLRAGDALIGEQRWTDAVTELRAFLKINRSSVEGCIKLARALAKSGDATAARAMRTEARTLYRELPAYQRRSQRVWYLRALVAR